MIHIHEAILERLDALERQQGRLRRSLRRWHVGAATVAGALLVASIAGAFPGNDAKPTEVESLVLKDRDGKIRATLELGADGEPSLSFIDSNGKKRLWLGLNASTQDGLTLFARDGSGLPRLNAGIGDKTSTVSLFGGNEGLRKISLMVTSRGVESLTFGDPRTNRIFLGRDVNDSTHLSFLEPGGSVVLGQTRDASGSLNFLDAEGRQRLAVGRSDDLSMLNFLDDTGKVRLNLQAAAKGGQSTIHLLDRDGMTRFQVDESKPPEPARRERQ